MNIFRDWIQRHFTDPQIIILVVLLVTGTVVILTMGKILTPVLASVMIAYLLEGLVGLFERWRIPRLIGALVVFLTFITAGLFLIFWLFPLLSGQLGQVLGDLPAMVARGQKRLMLLPERYPDIISKDQIVHLIDILQKELETLGPELFSFSVASVRGLITFLVYLILVPLMIFFFLGRPIALL